MQTTKHDIKFFKDLLDKYLKNENLKKHSLASAQVMKALAKKLNQDQDLWYIIGLVHDIDLDIEEVKKNHKIHAKYSTENILKDYLPPDALYAIKAHNDHTNTKRQSLLDHCLSAAETITGLIVATALVYPDKKLKSVKVKSIKKRFKEKRFAAGANRDHIKEIELCGINLEDFFQLSLNAMQEIADELGL